MKAIIKTLALGAIALAAAAVTSCSDQLDIDNDGRLSMEDIFSRHDRTIHMFSKLGSNLPKVDHFNRSLSNGALAVPMLASFSDEAHDASDGVYSDIAEWYNGRASATSFPVTSSTVDPWDTYFTAAYNCSVFLKNIQDPSVATYPFDPVQKNGWIAQARVMRAYYYWLIVKRYGAVPLADLPYDMDYDYSKCARPTFEECADFIIGQCDLALECEETENLSTGFKWIGDAKTSMTRFVAHALKSQVALYAASPLNIDGTGKYTWAKAAEITKDALDACLAHGAKLQTKAPAANAAVNCYDSYFLTSFDPSRTADQETFLQSTQKLANWKFAGLPINAGMKCAGPGPSQELVDCYDMADGTEPILGYNDPDHLSPKVNAASGYSDANPYEGRDPRFYASIYYNGCQRNLTDPSNVVYTCAGGNCAIATQSTDIRFTRTGYYMRKFHNYQSTQSVGVDGYMPLFRLAELYLNFAEAAYQSAGPDASVKGMSAREAVNAVRARVAMPGLPAGLSKADFERRYRKERAVELAFENHRYYDVRRWMILEQTDRFVTGMKAVKNADDTYTYTRFKLADRKCADAKYYRYPVPHTEVSKMQQLSGVNWQNPGW